MKLSKCAMSVSTIKRQSHNADIGISSGITKSGLPWASKYWLWKMRFGRDDDDSGNLYFHTSKVLEFFFHLFINTKFKGDLCHHVLFIYYCLCSMPESPRLAGDFDILQRLWASELFHQNPGRRPAGHCQTPVRWPDSKDSQGNWVRLIKVGVSTEVALVWRWIVIVCGCPQGSVGAILSRKDDTDTQDLVCQQLGKQIGLQTITRTLIAFLNHTCLALSYTESVFREEVKVIFV